MQLNVNGFILRPARQAAAVSPRCGEGVPSDEGTTGTGGPGAKDAWTV